MKNHQCPKCYSIESATSIFCSQCAARLTPQQKFSFETSSNNSGIYKPLTIVLGIFALVIFAIITGSTTKNTPTQSQANYNEVATPTVVTQQKQSDSLGAALQGENSTTSNSVIKVEVDTTKIYGNKRSFVYHWFGCPDFSKIAPKNRVVFNTVDEAEAKGYSPSSNCDTPSPTPESEELEAENITPETYIAPTPLQYSSTPVQTYEPLTTPNASQITRTEPRPVSTPYYSVPTSTPYIAERSSPSVETTSGNPTALCADGTYSSSQNNSGTCSHHGGVLSWLNSSHGLSSPTNPPNINRSTDTDYRPKTVYVRGYTRKDGTYVAPYTRRAPRRN